MIIFKIFKNKIPTSLIHTCNENCCRSSKADTSDEGDNEACVSPAVTVTTTTMTEVELPDRILNPYHYAEEGSKFNDTEA